MILPTLSGSSDFAAFRHAIKDRPDGLAFVAFDLLYLNGEELRALPLLERKERLWSLVEPAQGAIQFSHHVEASGPDFCRAVDGMGLRACSRNGPAAPIDAVGATPG
jgi:ATP-dependent DNA ligase